MMPVGLGKLIWFSEPNTIGVFVRVVQCAGLRSRFYCTAKELGEVGQDNSRLFPKEPMVSFDTNANWKVAPR